MSRILFTSFELGPGELEATVLQPSLVYAAMTGEERLQVDVSQSSLVYGDLKTGVQTNDQTRTFVVNKG